MSATKSAVILVAGEGKRLRPFTNSEPKCFARVAGKRILENALQALSENGCRHARIVTGHLGSLVREAITHHFAEMRVEFIQNAGYSTTNSMYSLALGLDGLDEAVWVLEGDVFFEHDLLALAAPADIGWFVDSSARHLDGSFVEFNAERRACSQKIIRDLALIQPNQAKSVGILKLAPAGLRQVQDWLAKAIAAGRQNDYYDLIVGAHMAESNIHAVDVAGHRWFEIDDNDDLQKANTLFA